MASPSAYGQYKQVQINTASPGKLVLLLYQGAINKMKLAIEQMDKKDFEGKGNSLIRAQDIVMELNIALDMDTGEIAASLRQLYLYIYKQLVDANFEMNKDAIRESIVLMERLQDAWEVAVQETEGFGKNVPIPSGLSLTG